jgi:hypothetical protein
MNEETNLSQDEEQELLEYLGNGETSFPKMQESNTIVGFFNKIFKTKDTTKGSNLNEFELEAVRIIQRTSNYARLNDLDEVSEYLVKYGEIILATALSKDGFFIESAVTSKKQLSTESKVINQGGKKGWGWKKQD